MDQDRVIMYEFEKANEASNPDQSGRMNRISKRFLFVQSALLYSTSDGQRRIRSHSIAIPISQILNEAFDYLDLIATNAILARKALSMFAKFCNIEECKQAIIKVMNNMAKGQMRCSKLQRGEQFQFSDNMQYLLMYALGTIKSQAIVLP
jgi:protein transport protein SEC24